MQEDGAERPAKVFDADPGRPIAVSFRPSYARRVESGFMAAYFSGDAILDIGFRGGDPDAVPITESAIGVELDYPGYDGLRLPFDDESQDTVLAAHVLEHIFHYKTVLKDWHRVLKIGGFLVIMVPHRDLYERIPALPSLWNSDHKRLYTPASLMAEIEESLPVNSYRLRHLVDNDRNFDYRRGPDKSPVGGFEIELVVQKIAQPPWAGLLRHSPETEAAFGRIDALVIDAVEANLDQPEAGVRRLEALFPTLTYFPPWSLVRARFLDVDEAALKAAIKPLLAFASFDADAYVAAHPDLQRVVASGRTADWRAHWINSGYFEGRLRRRADFGATD